MLQYNTIDPATLEVLKALMRLPQLNDFFLAGGTALSLYYGHRLSIDIDLFSVTDFNAEEIIEVISKQFPDFTYSNPKNSIGVFGFINNIKTDFVRYHYYSLIDEPVIEEGIRIMGIRDIMAMKVAAILKRAVKKDFWDIAELLEHYSVDELIDCYDRKFPNQQLLISIPQALTYFAEAEESENPVSLKGQTWPGIQKRIQKKVSSFLK